jgi:hypothetical protein
MGAVSPQLKVNDQNTFKSVQGGIISLVIYIVGFLYFILFTYSWINGGSLPKV